MYRIHFDFYTVVILEKIVIFKAVVYLPRVSSKQKIRKKILFFGI